MTFLSILLSLFFVNDTTNTQTDSIKQKEIREVVVYSIQSNKFGLPIVETTKNELNKRDFKTPADALQTQTGIALTRDGSWATSVNVRGMNEQRLLFLVDGDRLLTATDVAGTLSTVSMPQLEKIEVIKGAGSVLYGTGAVGGIVNFVSQRPGYSAELNTTGNVQGSYSSVNRMRTAAGTINITNKNWYLSATGNFRKAGDMNTPAGKIDNSQFNDASWSLNGGMLWGDNQELLIGYNEFKAWDAGLPGGAVFPKTAVVRYDEVKRRQMSAEYIFRNISNTVKKLSIKGYTQNIARDVENIVSATQKITPSSFNVTSGVKVTSDLYFNDYNTITLGLESWYRRAETFRTKYIYGADTTIIADQPSPMASVFNTGVFALYKKVIDPKYFNINFGARLDYFVTKNDTLFKELYRYKIVKGVESDKNYANRTVRLLPENKPDFAYAANVDFEYTPTSRQKLMLSLSSSYRIASIEERFKYIDQAGTPRIGNPDLKPEKGAMANLSYSVHNNRFRIRTDVFANYVFDLIAEKQGTYTSITGQQITALIATNINKAIYAGAEIEANWIISNNLSSYANASYVRAQDATTGDFLLMIPPVHGVVGLNYRFPKYFTTGLNAQWALKQNEAAATEVKTPGHFILNFDVQSAEIRLQKLKIKLNGGIDNLLDTQYKNHLFSTRGLDFYEPGRNLFVKLNCMW